MKKQMPDVVYHYCSLDTFKLIIENSTLRMTNIIKSNDLSEITFCIDEFIDAFRKAFSIVKVRNTDPAFCAFADSVDINKLIETSIKNVSLTYYVTCFSQAKDLLSQWRGYANDGQGVAIGFYTAPFVECADRQSWKFLPIYYDMEQIKDDLTNYIVERFMRPTTWKSRKPKISDYENVAITITSAMIYNAVFYKNPAFSEEQEYRLVYYPFGLIRNLLVSHKSKDMAANQLFYDRMYDTLMAQGTATHFTRSPVSFFVRKNSLVSYVDINFNEIKSHFISNIVLGPKAQMNDLDLRLFLLSNGYDISKIEITDSASTYR